MLSEPKEISLIEYLNKQNIFIQDISYKYSELVRMSNKKFNNLRICNMEPFTPTTTISISTIINARELYKIKRDRCFDKIKKHLIYDIAKIVLNYL